MDKIQKLNEIIRITKFQKKNKCSNKREKAVFNEAMQMIMNYATELIKV